MPRSGDRFPAAAATNIRYSGAMTRNFSFGLMAIMLVGCGDGFVSIESDTDAGSEDSSTGDPIDIDSTTGGGGQSGTGRGSTGGDSAEASSGGSEGAGTTTTTGGFEGSTTSEGDSSSDGTTGSSSSGGEESSSSDETTGDPTGDPNEFAGDYAGSVDTVCQGTPFTGELTFNVADDGTLSGTVEAPGVGAAPVEGTVDDMGTVDATADAILDTCTVDGAIDGVGDATGSFACPIAMCTGTWVASLI